MRAKEITAVYAAGLIQGIALVAFPAASTIFTSPHQFNFSSSDYGSLFIPQAILSIIASAFSSKLSAWQGSKEVYLAGLLANLMSMSLLALSSVVMHDPFWAYAFLILATSFLGIGFGLTVPTLNTMAALLYPEKVDRVILILNALLGVGTALAPVFIALFVGFGFWWGLPLSLVIFILLLFVLSLPLPLPGGNDKSSSEEGPLLKMPSRFWIFAAFALLYGIIETLNGNWILIYMKKYQNASIDLQSLALTVFWGMVTFGRIFFASAARYFRESSAYQILPFIAAAAFICISLIPANSQYFSVLAFGLAGFGCSALLPLTISFGTAQLKSIAQSVAGGVIAFYLLGYGIAAFGVGPLVDMIKLSLREIYALGAFIAVALGIVSFAVNKGRNSSV